MNLCTHPVPDYLERRITEKGGSAPNGLPLFRVIWGGDRLTIVGGEWNKFDSSGNVIGKSVEEKLCVKYPQAEHRWIFEMWCPSENYGSRERWQEETVKIIDGVTINTLGAYPHRGEYELLKVIETPQTGRYVPLTGTVCDALVAVARANKRLPHDIRMKAFHDAQARRDKEKEDRRIHLIEEIERPSFAQNEYVIVE